MEGQINLGTPFGNEIYNICKNTTYKTFCEIGTWNGRGTTRCVVQAIIDKENSEHNIFWSVEADPKFYDLAVNFYSDKYNSFLHLLKGTVNTKGVMTREEVQNHPLFQSIYGHYVLHYDTEYNSFKNCGPIPVLPQFLYSKFSLFFFCFITIITIKKINYFHHPIIPSTIISYYFI